MKKNLKKTRVLMFKRCNELLSSAMCELNQMQNAIDLDYNETEERERFKLFQKIADAYKWVNYAYIHDMSMSLEFELCAAIFKEVYVKFYNFKF